jgi:hypothetical protein
MLFEHDTKPIQGCVLPVNADTGEQFPNCCEKHEKMILGLNKWFEKFPNCCENHKYLAEKGLIKKDQYTGIVNEIALKIWYTQDCINRKLEDEDWFDAISEYIEYTIDSFGHSNIGSGEYRHYLINCIDTTMSNDSEKIKVQRIINFIENYGQVNESNTDLYSLYSTYQKWLNLFPFELSLFTDLKPRFESLFEMMEGGLLAISPKLLLSGRIEKNRYSNIVKVKIHSESSFVEALGTLTKYLLSNIDINELRKQGVITDLTATQLEFCEASLKTKTERITKDYTKGELEYLNTLEEWLGVHKVYFIEISKLLTKSPATAKQNPSVEIPKTFEELFYDPNNAETCLKILSELQPPVIDALNNYIGKAKGIFPLWINVLKNYKPLPLIKHFPDVIYKDLLNKKVNGLNLSKDASEFRKQYKRLIDNKVELDIKTILSQYSQSGILGK